MSGAVRAASPVERSEVDCPICRQQVVEENPSCLSACGHGMCRACAVDYVERELREARLPIPCPCCKASTAEAFGTGGASSSSREPAPAGGALTVAELHELLGTADMACFYDVSLKVYVAAHRQELYVCPTASCDYVADVAGWTHEEVKCPRCLALACPACSSPTHPGMACAAAAGQHSADESFVKYLCGPDNRTVRCRSCGHGIQKTEGCNHLKCRKCGAQTCWQCGEAYASCHACTAGSDGRVVDL